MGYRPDNEIQQRLDRTFRRLGGQVVPLRVDWAKRLESIHGAIVLQQLLFESRQHADPDGWFFLTAEDMDDLTAVGERGYAAARGKLEKLGLIETTKRGMPQRLYIRFDADRLDRWIGDVAAATPRDLLRHMAEQGATEGGTSSAVERDMLRPGTEHSIEDENLNENLQTKDLSKGPSKDSGENWTVVDAGLVERYIVDYSRELGDEAAVPVSVARAGRLWARAGVDQDQFVAALYEARTRTKRFTGAIAKQRGDGNGKNKMPYFFEVLEDQLGLRDTTRLSD